MRLVPAGFLFFVFPAIVPATNLVFEPEDNHFVLSLGGESVAVTADSLRFASGPAVRFEGANTSAIGRGEDRASGVSHYLLGNHPDQWRTFVPRFSRVSFRSVYPGVDLLYYTRGRQLEFDFTVAPRADPHKIRLRFSNARRLKLTSKGELEITTAQGVVRLKPLAAFQDGPIGHVPIKARYSLTGDAARIELEGYDSARALVIDPQVVFSTYAGDEFPNAANQMAVDSAGNIYVVGAPIIPTAAPLAVGSSEPADVTVSKFNPNGNLVYMTHLGGKGTDQGLSIAVDASGEAIVSGSTDSPDFPLWNPLQPWYGPVSTFSYMIPDTYGFIAKLSADGSGLIYSTYFGGHGSSNVNGVATDAAGNAYATGTTDALDFPVTVGAFQPTGGVAQSAPPIEFTGFVSKISPSGGQLIFSTYLGGTSGCSIVESTDDCVTFIGREGGSTIATDPSGDVTVAGYTARTDFPVTAGAIQMSPSSAFVTKLKPDGTGLVYSTYLIGAVYGIAPYTEDLDSITRLAVDQSGNAYITGQTASFNIPVTPGAYQRTLDAPPNGGLAPTPPTDAFVIKLNPTGSAAVFGTYLGGSGNDVGNSIAFDVAGNVYVTGITQSSDFPQTDMSFAAGAVFIAELSPGGALLYSGRFPGGSVGQDIAVDASGDVLALGSAASLTKLKLAAPTVAAVVEVASNRVAPGELVSIYGTAIGPSTGALGVFDSTGALTSQLSGVQVFFDGVPAPLLYVQNQLINAIVPYEVAGKTGTTLEVVGTNFKTSFPVGVTDADLRALSQSGNTVVFNSNGTVNSESNPAGAGSVVFLYATGGGIAFAYPGLKDGALNPASGYNAAGQLTASIGTGPLINVAVSYAGPAPALVNGVMQINLQLPPETPPSAYNVILTTGLSEFVITIYAQ